MDIPSSTLPEGYRARGVRSPGPEVVREVLEASAGDLQRVIDQRNTENVADAPLRPRRTTALMAALRAAPPPSLTVATIDEDFPRGPRRI